MLFAVQRNRNYVEFLCDIQWCVKNGYFSLCVLFMQTKASETAEISIKHFIKYLLINSQID